MRDMLCCGIVRIVLSLINIDRSNTIESSLGIDRHRSATCTHYRDLLANHINAVFFYITHEARAIGVVTDRFAVFDDYRIDGAHQLSSWRDLIHVARNIGLVRHGDVITKKPKLFHAVYSSFELIRFNIVSKVYAIDTKLFKRKRMHSWRKRMFHR